MPDESILNTYELYVDLPIFPDIFFKVTFSCNGYTVQSDQFNNAADALEWAQDELGSFGDWGLNGDTLFLVDSLCGVGSLTIQQSSATVGEGLILALDSSSPVAIQNNYELAAVDVSVNRQRATDTPWKNAVTQLRGVAIEPVTGSTSQWALYKSVGSDGYNIVLAEVTARGKNINTLLGGVGATTYGYGFFEDALGYIVGLSPEPQIIISLNLIRPALLGSYATTEDEIDYCVSACTAAGVTIKRFQLCYELGLQANNDVFSSGAEIADVTQTVVDYIKANHPTIEISIDCNLWDDANPYWDDLNAELNAVTDVDYVREYFQFEDSMDTYELCRERVGELQEMINIFRDEFTNGQKIVLSQSTFKGGNALREKVGEGLIYSELLINIIKKNAAQDNIINAFTHFNLSRLVASNASTFAAYDFMVLFRDAMDNDGLITYTLDNSDLVILAVKQGVEADVFIVNPTTDFVTIDSVTLNGTAQDVTVSARYGEPLDEESENYSASGASVLLYPHSLTKVSTT